MLELLAPLLRALVEARVLDCDCCPLGKDHDDVLVFGRELLAALFLGQVQVPVRLAADRDGDAEKAVHRRVTWWEAI